MFAQLYVDRAEKAFKAAVPEPSSLIKKIPFWKLTVKSWSADEFKKQVAVLTDDLISEYLHLKEKIEHAKEEAYHACLGEDKAKIKAYTTNLILLEHQAKAFDAMVPLVKTVQKNVKSIVKSKDIPDEYVKELSSIVYFSKFFTMPAFERVKAQLGYRYGQKFVDRIVVKGKTENVDEDVVENLNYECDKGELKDKMKELTKSSDTRAKEEARQIQESNQALTSVFVPSIGGSSSKSSTKDKKSKKSKKSKKVESESSDYSYSESESESESSSEEEKPKKKAKKEAKKEKKESKKEEKAPKEETPKVAEAPKPAPVPAPEAPAAPAPAAPVNEAPAAAVAETPAKVEAANEEKKE